MEESAPAIKVTALLLSYNNANAVRRSLAALEASEGREKIELLLVDCGSVDDSRTLDTEFPGLTILRLERNFGATKALNIGMRTAAGDYVFLLEPEVIIEPGTVMALAAYLDTDESTTAVCPLLVDEAGRPQVDVRVLPSRNQLAAGWHDADRIPAKAVDPSAAGPQTVDYPGRTALMVRKNFVRAINWLDARYGEFGGDLELAFQIRRSRKKILLIPSVRVTLTAGTPIAFDERALATIAADRALGASVFVSKHYGFVAGLIFTIGAAFHVLGRLVSFDRPGYQFRCLSALLSGQKIDGTQQTL